MTEADVQLRLCQWMRLQHKGLLWRSDYASGLRLSIPQARRHASLQSGRAWPDWCLYEPVGFFSGLALEIKKDGVKLFTKAGKPYSPHIAEQAAVLEALRERGWAACFVVGLDEAMETVTSYLNGQLS